MDGEKRVGILRKREHEKSIGNQQEKSSFHFFKKKERVTATKRKTSYAKIVFTAKHYNYAEFHSSQLPIPIFNLHQQIYHSKSHVAPKKKVSEEQSRQRIALI